MTPDVTLRPVGEADRALIADLQRRATDYFQLESGAPPGAHSVEAFLSGRPPSVPAEHHLHFAVCHRDDPVGLIDLLIGHPQPDDAYLGLLMLAATARGRGVGAAAVAQLRTLAHEHGAQRLLVAVLAENHAGMAFWSAVGFQTTKTLPDIPYGDRRHEVHRRELRL